MQIISSSTPCGEFFSWSHHILKSQQQATVAPSGSRTQPGSVAAGGGSRDLANIVKQSNELDLNIIIIWKVNAHLQDTKPNTHTGFHFVMRVHAGLRHRRQQTADPRGPTPCGPADHRQRGHVPEEQRGAAAVLSTSLMSQCISTTHVGRPRKALQSSIESFLVSSLLSNVPAGLWSVISLIYFEFHSLVCRLPTNCWWQ